MKFKQLLTAIKPVSIIGSTELIISGLAYDSRRVQPENVFFALPGVTVDGFNYLYQAQQAGASAIVAEQIPTVCEEHICYIMVANVRLAMAKMAAEFYGHPTADMTVIGVTGTNGKTTITYLLEAIFKQAGFSSAVFGTIEYRFGETVHAATHTTPESIDFLRLAADFRQRGANLLILEVSSHALEQYRVDGIRFDAALFTNLTQDHLDYHETMESYFASKRRLFTELLGDGMAIINRDDTYGLKLLQENQNWVSFGMDNSAEVYPLQVTTGRDRISAVFAGKQGSIAIESRMIGGFNVSNLLAAVATAQHFGISNEVIAKGLAAAPQVPGRVEKITNSKGILAIVDYSHTADALEQVLITLLSLDCRRLLTVVGCGGDRDQGKRPLMGAVAVKYSDLVVFTSDNPRTEEPLKILQQIRSGALTAGSLELTPEQARTENGFIVISDRREAIEFVSSVAAAGDSLLVAGKGHEDYQITGTEKKHFDDREKLYSALLKASAAEVLARKTGAHNHV